MSFAPQLIAALALFACGTALGLPSVRKIIARREALHELRRGSVSYLIGISGWIIIALWLSAIWYLATIIGDWWATQDLQGAIERSLLRLRILLEILAALGDN